MENLVSGLERLGKVAMQDKHLQFNNLMHHITPALFLEAYNKLNLKATKGVDNLSWQDYAKACEQRPIGITSLQDKIIQQLLVLVLEPIYEADFLGFSYGFRQLVKESINGLLQLFCYPRQPH